MAEPVPYQFPEEREPSPPLLHKGKPLSECTEEELIQYQAEHPDIAIGSDGSVLNEGLVPRGKGQTRRPNAGEFAPHAGEDPIDTARRTEKLRQKYLMVRRKHDKNMLNQTQLKLFEEMLKLGATNNEIYRAFPDLNCSHRKFAANLNRIGMSKMDVRKARRIRAEREREQFKKDIASNKPGICDASPPSLRLSDGRVIYADGTPVPVSHLRKDPVDRIRLNYMAAFRDAITYEDAREIVGVLRDKARNGEPWAIIEAMNRMFGKAEKGILQNAVESEIANRVDWSNLSDRELRALADISAKLNGVSGSSLNQPDIVEAQPTHVSGASNDQLPPPAQEISGSS